MKQKHYRVKLKNAEEDIHLCHCIPENRKSNAIVIFSHGFSVDGTESHRMFIEMAQALSSQNISSIMFDYRGCGYSGGKFEDLTPIREIEDLLAVYSFTINKIGINEKNLGLLGQSHGSYISLLSIPKMKSLKAICLWGTSVSPLERYHKNFSLLPKYNNMILLNKGFLLKDCFLKDMAKYDAIKSCKEITCPIKLIHAEKDEKVPLKEGNKAFNEIRAFKKFEIIKDANHSFKGQPDLQEKVIQSTLNWFNKYLRNKTA